jgi:hypothetical protein
MKRQTPNIPVTETAVPVEFFSQFSGGLNTNNKPEELLSNQSPDLLNVEATSDGAIVTTRGYEEIGTNTTAEKTIGIMPYINGATRHVITAHGYTLSKWSGSVWSDIKTYSTSSTSTSVTGVMAGGFLYIVDGAHAGMEKYTGSTSTSTIATPAVFTHLVYLPQVDRLVGISAANPSRVYFSGVGTYETWGANDYINVAADDGSDVKGLLPSFGPLMFLKGYGASGKFSWDGLTFASTGLRSLYGAGCENPKAACVIPLGGVAFFNRDGVWLNSGGSQQDILLSENITPTIKGITAGQLGKVRLHWFQNKLWLSLPLDGSTENNTILFLDFAQNEDGTRRGWFKLDWAASEFATYEDASGNTQLVFGSTTTCQVFRRYRLNETSSVWSKAGVAMNSYWSSYVRRGSRKAKPKNYKRLSYSFDALSNADVPAGQDALIDLAYRSDGSDSWRTLNVQTAVTIDQWQDGGVWGEDGDLWPGIGKQEGTLEDFFYTAKSIQWKVGKSGINVPFVFFGLAYEEEELESYTLS